eukprot:g3248.t1
MFPSGALGLGGLPGLRFSCPVSCSFSLAISSSRCDR